jgi:CubicO group peptidase (beta-lactamase class C family)
MTTVTAGGLSPTRLRRLHEVLAGHVERGDVPGLVALVSRHDDVHVETIGTMAFGGSAPMRRDTIFRIASLSKVVTAVAAMILVEECRLRLDDPIDEWLPELANRRVLRSLSSELDDTVPARRPITVRDLLTLRLGFGSVMAMPDTYPIQRFIREYRLGGDGLKLPTQLPPMEEWLRAFASLPLIAQPGERWMYHIGIDVLGILIARVTGRSLETFMRERIFDPLGMKDTSFHLPPEKAERLPAFYFFNHETDAVDFMDDPAHSAWLSETAFESGGGGLLSTLDDYFAFSRMLLNKGGYGSERILARATVELMTSDQLTPEQRVGSEMFFGRSGSWGLGMRVDVAREEIYQNPGRFGWDGGSGTTAYVDPAEGMIGIAFLQRAAESPEPPRWYTDFWTSAYAAIE